MILTLIPGGGSKNLPRPKLFSFPSPAATYFAPRTLILADLALQDLKQVVSMCGGLPENVHRELIDLLFQQENAKQA